MARRERDETILVGPACEPCDAATDDPIFCNLVDLNP
jgi:hypothetical protein